MKEVCGGGRRYGEVLIFIKLKGIKDIHNFGKAIFRLTIAVFVVVVAATVTCDVYWMSR